MQKLKELLHNKRGEMYLRACFLILIISMVFFLVFCFCLNILLISGQRKSAMQTLDKYTQLNAIQIHDSIKMTVDDTDSLDATVYTDALCLAQSLVKKNNAYYAYNGDGNCIYYVSDISMNFTVSNTTKIQVSYTLNVPFRFMGTLTWIRVPLTLHSRLDPKFFQSGETTQKMYTVRHWQEGLDGTYVLHETWSLYATTASVTPKTATYPGFTSPKQVTTNLTDGKKTVVDYYYTRNSYTISVSFGDGVTAVRGAGTYKFGEEVTLSVVLDAGYFLPYWEGDPEWMTNRYALVHRFVATSDVDLTVTAAKGGDLNILGLLDSHSLTMQTTTNKTGPIVFSYYASFTPSDDVKAYINAHWNNLDVCFQYFMPSDAGGRYALTDYYKGESGGVTYIALYYTQVGNTSASYAIVIPEGAAFIEIQSSQRGTVSRPSVGYLIAE